MLRGIVPGQILIHKKSIGWANGDNVVTMAGIDRISGVRMAEWLKPGLWEVLTIMLRGIKLGRTLAHKKSIGWADGDEKHVLSLLWLA